MSSVSPAFHPFDFLAEIRVRQKVGKQNIEALSDIGTDRIGNQIIDIIETDLCDQLKVFDHE